jgi:uncharacterized protein (TIGR00251 family)
LKITVDVKPNSKTDSIKKLGEFHYLVTLKAPAQKGKANLALMKLLKKYFKKDVRLIHGSSSRRKIFVLIE